MFRFVWGPPFDLLNTVTQQLIDIPFRLSQEYKVRNKLCCQDANALRKLGPVCSATNGVKRKANSGRPPPSRWDFRASATLTQAKTLVLRLTANANPS